MIRKSSTFGRRRLLGIIYFIAQFLGGLIAGVACLLLLAGTDITEIEMQPNWWVDVDDGSITHKWLQSFLSEALGSFIYVLFFMICTDKKYQYSNDKVLNTLVSASSYITA